ncbi:FtsW/RodA/SpoVE family cell cycle protein [Georgenia sp. Z1344]|uniref:FtsW/RodA/SpoVE family cell cycle protein n=1 Tax=Georgenia sp. Z1344 TaxID=3416706 RepID=UPI003CF033D6
MRQQSARSGRWPELGLLALAVALVLLGYVQVALNTTEALPTDLHVRGGIFAGMALVAHLVVRWRAPYADPVILPSVVLLNGIGLTMIHRIDIAEGSASVDRQLMWTGIGIGLCLAVLLLVRDHRALRGLTYTSMIVGIVLLLLPMVPGLGRTINGARIWIGVGPLSFQPAEVAKIALAIFFAGYLVANRDNLAFAGPKVLGMHLPRPRDLGPILIAWGVGMAVLVLQRDLGTAVLFFGMFVALMYLATERISWVVLGGLLAVGGAMLAATLFPHVGARVDVWLNALDPAVYSRSPGGSGQLVQGLFGLASGGLMGSGWGLGYPQLVPYAESDFIMASLGEELGLTGLIAILLIYLIVVQRGMRASIAVRDGFGKLLAAGLAFTMALQVFVVVGGVTRLIPLTGLTTPFLALGGSSLVANWVIIALLLRVSDAGRRPAPVADPSAVAALGVGSTAPSPDVARAPAYAGAGRHDATATQGAVAAGGPAPVWDVPDDAAGGSGTAGADGAAAGSAWDAPAPPIEEPGWTTPGQEDSHGAGPDGGTPAPRGGSEGGWRATGDAWDDAADEDESGDTLGDPPRSGYRPVAGASRTPGHDDERPTVAAARRDADAAPTAGPTADDVRSDDPGATLLPEDETEDDTGSDPREQEDRR